jgi:tyrosine ammonia-lyase
MSSAALILGPDTWIDRTHMLRAALGPVDTDIATPQETAEVLDAALARGASVYGHSTGYGALASFPADEETHQQQAQLIAHLATGTGPPFDARTARALVFDRLVTLSKGRSSAGVGLLDHLSRLLATDAAPRIPRYGSVGASGDLTPLAHVALAITGEGSYLPGRATDLDSFVFTRRDALALVNGTSASNALAVLAWWDIAALIPILLRSMALMVNAQRLAPGAYAETLHHYRGQPGQIAIAAALRGELHGMSKPSAPAESNRHGATPDPLVHERELQSAYCFRCIPQIMGPTLESLWHTGQSLDREINAVTDNPVFDMPDQVFHGGNFHGQVVAQACDSLSLGVANLAILLDRQIARITDPMLNHQLSPFLTGATVGAHSGFMGAQVSATALTAELSASAQRRYLLQSRSTNGANQDVVSMSTLAGVALYESLPRLRELAAIHLMAAVQATDLSGSAGDDPLHAWVRERFPFLMEDRPLSDDIQRIAADLATLTSADLPGERPDSPPNPALSRATWDTLFAGIPDPATLRAP